MASFFCCSFEQRELTAAYLLLAVDRPVSAGDRLLITFFFFLRKGKGINPFLKNVILLEIPFRVDGNFAKAKAENWI